MIVSVSMESVMSHLWTNYIYSFTISKNNGKHNVKHNVEHSNGKNKYSKAYCVSLNLLL